MAGAAAPEHFIAERHKLEVVAPESELRKSWEGIVAFCGTIQCEVVSSSITTRTGELEPSGALLLRVVPGDLQKVLDRIQSAGQIATYTTERVDKTTEVIDTEAKIPWLILIVPGIWVLAKVWRRLRRNRKGTAAPAAVEPPQKA